MINLNSWRFWYIIKIHVKLDILVKWFEIVELFKNHQRVEKVKIGHFGANGSAIIGLDHRYRFIFDPEDFLFDFSVTRSRSRSFVDEACSYLHVAWYSVGRSCTQNPQPT